ncbi:MAG: hypothetical protein ABSG65_05185 [Bryobacteraceae bacterium]
MTQTLHILRKDIRRLRFELCVTMALTGAFAWSDAAFNMPGPPQFSRAAMLAALSAFFLVCAWWFLVTQLIHEESLAGDRQFWVTRPYLWRHLLAAKLLFVVALINIPLLAAQVLILAAAGYPVLAAFPQLLWMQIAFTAVFLVPLIALGTVTRNLAQFVLTLLCGLIAWYLVLLPHLLFFIYTLTPWPNKAVSVCVACAGAALVIGWQFLRRSTKASIRAGLCTLLLSGVLYYGLPMPFQRILRSSVSREPEPKGVSVYMPPDSQISYSQNPGSDRLLIGLPFAYTGLPWRTVARPEMIDLTIDAPYTARWSSGWESPAWGAPVSETSHAPDLAVPPVFFLSFHGATVSMHGSMLLSVRRQIIVPLPPGRATRIPGGGFCEVSPGENQSEIFCSSPFRPPYDVPSGADTDIDHGSAGIERHSSLQLLSLWESPFPDLALSPVFIGRASSPIGAEVTLIREYSGAWIKRDFASSVRMPRMPGVR